MLTGRNSLEKQIEDHIIQDKEKYYRIAFSYVKNVEDALDIVQESIYKAMSTIESLKNPMYIKTWFYRIVVNTSLDLLRKQKKVVVIDKEVLDTHDLGTIDTYTNVDLERALDELPDYYRTIIILRFFEDLTIKEIAQVLDQNVNTVKTHLYKTLEKLRIKMND